MPVCNRKTCGRPFHRGYYRIWNKPSTNEPRLYCITCGRKIIEYNQGSEIKLRYEIVETVMRKGTTDASST